MAAYRRGYGFVHLQADCPPRTGIFLVPYIHSEHAMGLSLPLYCCLAAALFGVVMLRLQTKLYVCCASVHGYLFSILYLMTL